MKRIALLAALFVALVGQAGGALAQYPVRSIRIVIPFGPGSATDSVMRVLAPHLSAGLGQPVVIDPKPGADGAVSASGVARSAPDGYTLGVGSGGPLAAVPALRKNPPYDVNRDFTPITDIGRYTVFLYVNSEVPVKTFQEFVSYVKANPGKLAYGTGNPSGIVAFAQMNALLGLDMLHVPYKSAPLVMPDLLANRVQVLMDPPAVALGVRLHPLLPRPAGTVPRPRGRPRHPRALRVLLGHHRPAVSYTHLRAHETPEHPVCRLPLEKKKPYRTMVNPVPLDFTLFSLLTSIYSQSIRSTLRTYFLPLLLTRT